MNYALITTGGTIAGLRTDEAHYSAAQLSGEDWAEHMGLGAMSATPSVPLSRALRHRPDSVDPSQEPIQWRVYSPYAIGSQHLGWAQLFELRSVLMRVLTDPSTDGVLVTHGTDTMEDTLFFLSCTVPESMWLKPVVFTGSMLTSDSPNSDASANVQGAVHWLNTQCCMIQAGSDPDNIKDRAADSQPAHAGFGLWMNQRFTPAAQVRKWRTAGVDAFDPSPGLQAFNPNSHLPVFQLPDDVGSFLTLVEQYPVHVLYWTPMLLNNPLLKVSAWRGTGSLIVAAPGNGNIPEAILKPLGRLMAKGVRVVRASRISTSELLPGGELTGLEDWAAQSSTAGLSLYAEAHGLSLSQVVLLETLKWLHAATQNLASSKY